MASLVDDIGEALETALKANSASFAGAINSPGGTLHIEYNDTPENTGNLSGGGSCYIRFDSARDIQAFADSAFTEFTYTARFNLTDLAGKNKALAVVQKGMTNTFAERGATVLSTHFTDNGSNRLGKSGNIAWEIQATPVEGLSDYDQAVITASVRVNMWRNIPEA